MNTLAALMVIVACHSQDTSCLEEPVAVISYETGQACRTALPQQMRQAERLAGIVYGDCIPVDAELVAGRDIHRSIDPAKLASLDRRADASSVEAQAMMPQVPRRIPVPLDRFQEIK
ncbi:hypothetical protein PDO_4262 [Rhizobium sp. PDO1-076]|uniref:hypothetical protein n=1 Tax=Rhizobium sp. PDO1-076 TaxID=1125979 RepID=UPI00024E38DE|nr:hypothetical protein [Rhizobium sp. PDO1-076]EHS53332.1 hypothetical protein PDO_4262 [Rhizobium sp. PDO1-076]